MTDIINLDSITKIYKNFPAVKGVSLQIREGEILGLIGHNGAGKTTTLKMIVGLLAPTSGTITVMGQDITLDDIEHEILREEFKDPRIHFVLVCAAMGCPLLESKAFFADNVNQRLERATENFINNSEKVKLDQEKNVLFLSSFSPGIKGIFRHQIRPNGNLTSTVRKKEVWWHS